MNRITSSEGSASVRWAALVVALALAGEAGAAPATRFEPEMQVQGTPLLLNGAGTRYKAIFKVYDAALYVPRKVSTTEELLALPGLKRLQFMALRDMPSAEIGRLFHRAHQQRAVKPVHLEIIDRCRKKLEADRSHRGIRQPTRRTRRGLTRLAGAIVQLRSHFQDAPFRLSA